MTEHYLSAPLPRHRTIGVDVGGVIVGGGAPVVVQSMTNTDTADVNATVGQVAALARAGSEIVRITVDRDEAAAAVPHIKERLLQQGCEVPIVGDFHYIGHKLLADHPACAEALDKYRINPGNVGFKDKKDRQFGAIVETAIKHGKPVRIGANWGSLDQELLTHLMDENSRSNDPKDAREVTREAMIQSALLSAQRAEEIGLPFVLPPVLQEVRAEAELRSLRDDAARRAADDGPEDLSGNGADLEFLTFGGLRRAVPQHDVADLVRHHASSLALRRRRFEHSAIEEHRSAGKREGVDLAHVHDLERVLEFRVPEVGGNGVDEPLAEALGVRRHRVVPKQRQLLPGLRGGLLSEFDVLRRRVFVGGGSNACLSGEQGTGQREYGDCYARPHAMSW